MNYLYIGLGITAAFLIYNNFWRLNLPKPMSLDERIFMMAAKTDYSLKDIRKLMDIAGMNIDELESVVYRQHIFNIKSLDALIEEIQNGTTNWKELIYSSIPTKL